MKSNRPIRSTGRLFFDVTKALKHRHKSGLMRVSECLRRELKSLLEPGKFIDVVFDNRRKTWKPAGGRESLVVGKEDIFLTGELFCESERSGIKRFLMGKECRSFALFYDAIPLQFPEFTWPRSVQRHPGYMKLLSRFDGIFAISEHSSNQLKEYWRWLGLVDVPSVNPIQLGADGVFREPSPPKKNIQADTPNLISLGIIEKRKGQDLALRACEQLWKEGLEFKLHFIGRTNPHFGKDIEKKIKQSMRGGRNIVYHGQINDIKLQRIFKSAGLTLFPSRAEGYGLPVLESLWKGIPVLCSNLDSVREIARFGGCQLFQSDDAEDLTRCLRSLITDRNALPSLRESIQTQKLPRWKNTVREIMDHLTSKL